MKSIVEALRDLTGKQAARVEKGRKIAENMIKAAEAAKEAAQKK